MTIDAPAGIAIVETASSSRDQSSYVDWPAIIAGIVLASAISVVLLGFGSAIGLNFLDFGYREGPNPMVIGIVAASWFLWVEVSSFMAGGYLTGRLRRRHLDADADESDVRDGAHGLLVWAGAVIIGGVIAVSGIGAVINAVGSTAATVTTAAADAVDPNAYFVDSMFRTTRPGDSTQARTDAVGIFAQAALGDGTVSAEDRTYLAEAVAANTGLTAEEAQVRVDQAIADVEAARQQAIEAARIARNSAIIGGFLLAASLLVSAIGAFWAAQKGGDHRDTNRVFTGVFRRF